MAEGIAKKARKAKESKGILVPMIENFMEKNAVEISSPEDVKFLHDLQTKMMWREEHRRTEGLGVFSPSSLGDPCVRKSYLTRHAVRPEGAPSPYDFRSHYFFLTGNFLHIKWMFVLYKMEKQIANPEIFAVYDYERGVRSKRGDNSGTIDVIAFIHGEPFVIDFKGLNTWSATKVGYGKIPTGYKSQVGNYLVLWNAAKAKPFGIKRGLLVVEDKSGAKGILQEAEITLAKSGRRVRNRLELLRSYEERKEMPPPLCKSLKDKNFIGCQFRGICWDEVEAAGKAHTENMRALLAVKEPTTADRVRQILRKGK
jgi:hypothetical protein